MLTHEEIKTPFRLKDQLQYKDGEILTKGVYKTDNGSVTLLALANGTTIARHQAPFDVMAYVAEGKVEFEVEDQRQKLDCCDAILLPADTPHTVTALDNAKIILVKIKP